jgi:hypothetical protein
VIVVIHRSTIGRLFSFGEQEGQSSMLDMSRNAGKTTTEGVDLSRLTVLLLQTFILGSSGLKIARIKRPSDCDSRRNAPQWLPAL